MPDYETPGVYVEEIPTPLPSIKEIPTSVIYVGYTEFAIDEHGHSLMNIPTKIASLEEFELYFGKAKPTNFSVDIPSPDSRNITINENEDNMFILYYSVENFYKNFDAGLSLTILSLGSFTEKSAPSIDDYKKALEILNQNEDFTVLVFSEMQYLQDDDYADFVTATLEICQNKNRFFIIDLPNKKIQCTYRYFEEFRNLLPDNRDELLTSCAAYFSSLETNSGYLFSEEKSIVNIGNQAISLHALKNENPELYSRILFRIKNKKVILPPSSFIAKIYLKNDAERGIWKAPSTIPLPVKAIFYTINEVVQSEMNVHPTGKSINAIRNFPGKGTLVWGARTLNGNNHEFRYINVVRFIKLIKASINRSLDTLVFETNNSNTCFKIKSMVENFLHQYWRNGALQGEESKYAYYVRCGLNENMTENDLTENHLIIDFAIALFRPGEFINIRIHKNLNSEKS